MHSKTKAIQQQHVSNVLWNFPTWNPSTDWKMSAGRSKLSVGMMFARQTGKQHQTVTKNSIKVLFVSEGWQVFPLIKVCLIIKVKVVSEYVIL